MDLGLLFAFVSGAFVPTCIFLMQSRRESQRFRLTSLENRFNELTERLGHSVQFVRAGAVRGVVDTAISIESESRDPHHRYLRRATKLLATMLSTDEDQAVGFELIGGLVTLATYAIEKQWADAQNEIVGNTIAANLAASRWFGDSLCVLESIKDMPGCVAPGDPRLMARFKGQGFTEEQVNRAFESSLSEGRLEVERLMSTAGRPPQENVYWALDYVRRAATRLSRTGEAAYLVGRLIPDVKGQFDWSNCTLVENGLFRKQLQTTLPSNRMRN